MNTSTRQTSAFAIVSLISGVLGWTLMPLLGCIVAVITGHLGRAEIRRQPELYQGDGLAVIGLVLGYVGIGMAVLAVATFVLFFGGLAWLGSHH